MASRRADTAWKPAHTRRRLPPTPRSVGLDYPGVGPEHAWLKENGHAQYVAINDDEALAAFHDLCRLEGIIPALESAHAVAYGLKLARELGRGKRIIVNLSGRGDKDINTIAARDGITL